MKRFLANWELKILAIMAAVIFWFLVIGTENTFYAFPQEIPIRAFNLSDEFVVANDLGGVNLRLKIENRDIIKNLDADDFSAYVDLEGLGEGERETRVVVSSKNSDVRVLRIEPSNVIVNIEKKVEKEVKVEYKILGEPKDGYKVDEVVFKEKSAVIRGSKRLLSSIDETTLKIELDGEDSGFTDVYPLKIFDSRREEIMNISIIPSEIEVEVKIKSEIDRKLVGVQPNITGTPPGNRWIKSIIAEPSFVILEGEFEELQKIEYTQTEEIDVSNIDDSSDFNVSLINLPNNVKALETKDIKVSIEIEKMEYDENALKQKQIDVPVTVVKFRTNQESRVITPPSVTIVVEGTEQDLGKISPSATIELDISDYKDENEAVFQINESNFSVPRGVKIISAQPSRVKVSW